MLDELLLGGEVQETSKKNVLKAIAAQDLLQEVRLKYLLPSMFENFVIGKTIHGLTVYLEFFILGKFICLFCRHLYK